MDFYVARAVQIAALDPTMLEDLHEKEKIHGMCMMNWEIQERFGLPKLKEHWGIPADDLTGQAAYMSRVKEKIRQLKLWKTEAEGFPSEGDLEATHAYDWTILNRAQEVDFYYERRTKSRLREQVEKLADQMHSLVAFI